MSDSDYPQVPVTDLKPGDVILVGNGPKQATVTRPPSKPFTDMYGRELVRVWIQQGVRPYSHTPEDRARDYFATGSIRRVKAAPATTPLADALAHLDRVQADDTNIASWVQKGRELTALGKLAEAVRDHLASPSVIACKCCADNECECGGHKTGPVTRTGEIQVTS